MTKQRINDFHGDMIEWRHDIHAHPETAFEEVRTASLVAEKLSSFGIEVHEGLAKTGVVGVLQHRLVRQEDRASCRSRRIWI